MKKVVFISNSPNNYQYNFFETALRFIKIECFFYYKEIKKNNYKWVEPNKKKVKIVYSNNKKIDQILKQKNIDVILLGYVKYIDLVKILFRNIKDKKKIFFFSEVPNSNDHYVYKFFRYLYHAIILRYLSGVFCIGRKSVNYFTRINKCTYYFPYSINSYKLTTKKKFQVINFIFIGQLINRKSILETIESFIMLSNTYTKNTLTIIGSGDYENYCRKASKQFKNINFYGFRNQNFIRKKLNDSHVLLHPSKYDGWSVVVMQAMNAGLGIIGSKETNCVYDYIKHRKNGFVCEPKTQSIYNGMKFYVKNKNILKLHMKKNKMIFDKSLMNSYNLSKRFAEILNLKQDD